MIRAAATHSSKRSPRARRSIADRRLTRITVSAGFDPALHCREWVCRANLFCASRSVLATSSPHFPAAAGIRRCCGLAAARNGYRGAGRPPVRRSPILWINPLKLESALTRSVCGVVRGILRCEGPCQPPMRVGPLTFD
jgi:hypothetical protein